MHEAPNTRTPWYTRVGEALRYLLSMEPVAVAAVWRAVLVLAAAVGLAVPDVLDARVSAGIVAFYGLVEVITTVRARHRVWPTAKVVEAVDNGQRIAGEASPVATGTVLGPAPTPPFPPS